MGVRYREYNINQTYFTVIDPEHIKQSNSLLSTIDSFIEEQVSTAPFDAKVRNKDEGAPSVHPKMMLKILFYSYARGVYSSREMERRLLWDQNYIYLSGNQKVDYSTICNFILKYSEEIKEIFTKMVYVMTKLGYIDFNFIAIDGTKIRANASKEFTGNMDEFKAKKKKIEEKIENLLKNATAEGQAEMNQKRFENKIDQIKKQKEKIDKFLTEVEGSNKEEKIKKTDKINLTDRDARFVKDRDEIYTGYNCQAVADDKNHIIIGAGTFNKASDRGLLKPMIEEVKKHKNGEFRDTEISLDAGYFSSENLKYSSEKKLNIYLPEGKGEGGKKKRKDGSIGSRDCKMEIQDKTKRLICPGGQVMESEKALKDRENYFYRFYPLKEKCEGCKLRESCYENIKRQKRFSVKKEYFDTLDLRERMNEKLSSPSGKQRMADRACIIEHIFGEIKEHRKFRRFLHRGLTKVNLIWIIVCIAYNFIKLSRLGYG